ncbi:RNA polymerase sigma factor [Micromonospora sp. NPDC007230]|uniref:RNA polymerase sigma factor n=1 Tax=Micromonospora sp. NPDC007230 TaxID=3364237 RepID=UPI00369D29B5
MEDEDAWFTCLYTEMHPRVLAYAVRRIAADQAVEVTDETFLIAWRRRKDLPEPALPWLLVTARNLIGEQLRKGQREDAIAVELARCAKKTSPSGADAVVVERMTVLAALAQLADQDREALILTVWDGLGHRQAAAVAGCSTMAFTVRLHRARRRFAAALEQIDGRRDSGGERQRRSGHGQATLTVGSTTVDDEEIRGYR